MSKQINQYTKTRTAATIKDDDLIDLDSDENAGVGPWESAKMTWAQVLIAIGNAIGTIYTTDSSLTGTRQVDLAEFVLTFTNGCVVIDAASFSVTTQAIFVPAGTSQDLDIKSGNGMVLDLGAASGNVTLTVSNEKDGAIMTLKVIQGATPRTLIYPANFKWEGGTALVPTATNNAEDLITGWFDGTNWYLSYGTNFS